MSYSATVGDHKVWIEFFRKSMKTGTEVVDRNSGLVLLVDLKKRKKQKPHKHDKPEIVTQLVTDNAKNIAIAKEELKHIKGPDNSQQIVSHIPETLAQSKAPEPEERAPPKKDSRKRASNSKTATVAKKKKASDRRKAEIWKQY